AMRFRAAYRIVQPIHMANATRNNARRSPPPESAGSWASLSAMPAWNGFVGPKALPIIAAPALIATTTTPSTPRPRPSTRSSGKRADRRLRHPVVGASHNDAPAGRWVVPPVEGPRRKNPRERGRNKDSTEQEDERIPRSLPRFTCGRSARVSIHGEKTYLKG